MSLYDDSRITFEVPQPSMPSLTTPEEFLIEDRNNFSVPAEPLFASQLAGSTPENTAASFGISKSRYRIS
jgi:hypothetical protein